MRIVFMLPLVLVVSACEEPEPIVSDFNGSSVRIQQSTVFTPADADAKDVVEEARRICARVGKEAEYASSRPGPNSVFHEHLFLCL